MEENRSQNHRATTRKDENISDIWTLDIEKLATISHGNEMRDQIAKTAKLCFISTLINNK